MEYKFTSDGKKVVVIGKLNNAEIIVQEVFVSNGNEFPSGENFVVKSLHDAPVKSWLETRTEALEKRYSSLNKEVDDLYEVNRRKKQRIIEYGKTMDTQLNWMKGFMDKSDEDSFKNLFMFINGSVTHLVSIRYEIKIMDFVEFMSDEYGMKLLTMFGKDDGSLNFAVARYTDGSGSWNDKQVVPATSYEEAVKIAQAELTKKIEKDGNCGSYDIQSAEKYGLTIEQKYLNDFYEKRIKEITASMENTSKMIVKYKNEIEEFKSKIK